MLWLVTILNNIRKLIVRNRERGTGIVAAGSIATTTDKQAIKILNNCRRRKETHSVLYLRKIWWGGVASNLDG